VDHSVKNPGEPARLTVGSPPESFSEQLASFFRRNALWFLVIALAWLLVQDVFGTHGVLAMHRSKVEVEKIQSDINKLDEDNQKLQDNVQDLKSNPVTIEGIAREQMGLARPTELVFPTEKNPASTPQSDPAKK
jgi:cell division protein FtsB